MISDEHHDCHDHDARLKLKIPSFRMSRAGKVRIKLVPASSLRPEGTHVSKVLVRNSSGRIPELCKQKMNDDDDDGDDDDYCIDEHKNDICLVVF